jgi:hypothetical protein
VLQKRKQQLLQRMKGSAAAAAAGAGAAAAAASAASSAQTSPPAAAAAADELAAAEAAAAADVAPAKLQLQPFELEPEADQLLQELIEMAEELAAAPDGFGLSSLVDNDPLADPLAALTSDVTQGFEGFGTAGFGGVSPAAATNGSNGSSSNGSSNSVREEEAVRALDAFAAELAAAKKAMQQFQAGSSSSSSAAGESSQQQQQQDDGFGDVVRTSDLLAWEAEEARKITEKLTTSSRKVTSMESALLAVRQEQLREQEGGDEGEEGCLCMLL